MEYSIANKLNYQHFDPKKVQNEMNKKKEEYLHTLVMYDILIII